LLITAHVTGGARKSFGEGSGAAQGARRSCGEGSSAAHHEVEGVEGRQRGSVTKSRKVVVVRGGGIKVSIMIIFLSTITL
jgi:hypothetical protein